MFFSFEPTPKLIVDGVEYYGINIIEKLCELRSIDSNAEFVLEKVANMHQRMHIPQLGFHVEYPDAVVPTKRDIDVGYDITVIAVAKHLTPKTIMFETGISLSIPLGFYVEMIPRSSLSKTGYMFANSIGVIDPAYTGTLKVALIKVDDSVPDLELPSRVAQIILKPYVFSDSYVADKDSKLDTTRGTGGFGSTN